MDTGREYVDSGGVLCMCVCEKGNAKTCLCSGESVSRWREIVGT